MTVEVITSSRWDGVVGTLGESVFHFLSDFPSKYECISVDLTLECLHAAWHQTPAHFSSTDVVLFSRPTPATPFINL